MTNFNTAQIAALAALADAYIPTIERPAAADPTGYWQRKASDLDIAQKVIVAISTLPPDQQEEFQQLLKLLNSRLLGLTWGKAFRNVHQLSIEERQAMLQSWSTSRFAQLRKAFNSLKKLIGFLYFGDAEPQKPNPNWVTTGYPGPLPLPSPKPPLPTMIRTTRTIYADVLVIGSGAGGGVVAAQLAQAGKKVIIVEKGKYLPDSQLNYSEVDMMQQLYEQQGMLSNTHGNMTILAGSTLGGGTTINWSASLRTPDEVLHEWANEHNNPHFEDREYTRFFEQIEARTHIQTQYNYHNPQNQNLLSAAQKLGYRARAIPLNIINSNNSPAEMYHKRLGYGCLGDAYGDKQSVVRTFLQDAVAHQAEIYCQTWVERILTHQGNARGAIAYQTHSNGKTEELQILAPKVVVCCGAIHTPALLQRSGLRHPQIGKNLYLHPVVPVIARYSSLINPWYGPMMSAICDEFAYLDGNHGVRLECGPAHIGLMGLVTPWESGEAYKQRLAHAAHYGNIIVLTRDKFGGEIRLDKQGNPHIHYTLSNYDRHHMLRGIQESIRLHVVANADEVYVCHNSPLVYEAFAANNLDYFLKKIANHTWEAHHFELFSAHQMGSCRMGGSKKHHPLLPTGQTREIKGLFVADTSAFPSSSGTNPMLSVQALAAYIAQHIA